MGPLYTPFEGVLRMERRPLLINTARGGLVDECALVDALTTGQIAGAGFDVVTTEPPPADIRSCTRWRCRTSSLHRTSRGPSREGLPGPLTENIGLFWRGSPRNLVVV